MTLTIPSSSIDLHIVEAVQRLRTLGITGGIYAGITAYNWDHDNEITIEHFLDCTVNGSKLELKGASLVSLIDTVSAMMSIPHEPPASYTKALPAPAPVESEYAEFTEAHSDDGVPF